MYKYLQPEKSSGSKKSLLFAKNQADLQNSGACRKTGGFPKFRRPNTQVFVPIVV
jgi:hypothetical protein